ncbi:carbohydrate-binding module family 13 protein [Suillus clintonianus]|uniref:carbohydrate-binding module family 13 protein n=1 Tax=Suillus clintonianus TaxID=1904413 RepID=UPI001B881565|nr:carbohydrate-binding module family 13 protein [Suillus clintonianus]KAG2122727.1 carbohydrate-binding module family 13 protein [Suillus clintonianus]
MSCIQNGRAYTLKNCQAGTVMDLSGGNNYSIIGYHNNGGLNQLWIFQHIRHGDQQGWYIKSAGSDKYLSIEGGIDDAGNGTKVVAVESESPFLWDVKDSDIEGVEGLRILVHGKKFSVDLSDNGNATEGTPVQLWTRWHGRNQIWEPIERNWCADFIRRPLLKCISY